MYNATIRATTKKSNTCKTIFCIIDFIKAFLMNGMEFAYAIFIVWWDTVNVCVVHFDETILACPTDVVTEWYEDAFLGNTPAIGRYGPGNCGISQEDAATVAEYVFSNSELDRILF